MAVVNAQPLELLLKGTKENISIEVVDSNGTPVNATKLTIAVLNASGSQILVDDFANPGTRIVKVSGATGRYYFPFGAVAGETDVLGDFLFQWYVEVQDGTEGVSIIQTVKVASATAFSVLPYLRNLLDKAVKEVRADIGVFVGYDDAALMQYLEGGVQLLNVYGQDQYAYTIDTFPVAKHRVLLLLAAAWVGLTAQAIYAADTDIDFSDQGYSLALNKFPKIQQMQDKLERQIQTLVRPFKETHIRTGSIRTEMGPGFRFQQVLQASPAGAIFRNFMVAGK
jgi:hypothetical protein